MFLKSDCIKYNKNNNLMQMFLKNDCVKYNKNYILILKLTKNLSYKIKCTRLLLSFYPKVNK